jgi:DNA-directed RNA polymerase subunit N (RpoN/RPB10)
MRVGGINYVPIYCFHCGKQYGMVPDTLITHVSALCDDGCSDKYGHTAHFYVDADAKFRTDQLEAAQKVTDRLGRPVTAAELDEMAKDACSPLAAVARDWQAHVRKAG